MLPGGWGGAVGPVQGSRGGMAHRTRGRKIGKLRGARSWKELGFCRTGRKSDATPTHRDMEWRHLMWVRLAKAPSQRTSPRPTAAGEKESKREKKKPVHTSQWRQTQQIHSAPTTRGWSHGVPSARPPPQRGARLSRGVRRRRPRRLSAAPSASPRDMPPSRRYGPSRP